MTKSTIADLIDETQGERCKLFWEHLIARHPQEAIQADEACVSLARNSRATLGRGPVHFLSRKSGWGIHAIRASKPLALIAPPARTHCLAPA